MPANERVLYQFPLSLYCEKTRWNLKAKGLDFSCRDLLPGPHRWTAWRLARQNTLPVLKDGRHAVGDSTAIALYLEQQYPQRPLLPAAPEARQRALALEAYFDTLGEHVRRYVWSMTVERPEVSRIFFGFEGYSPWRQALADRARPLLRQMIRRTFNVYEGPVAASEQAVAEGLVRLEALLDGNADGYLSGQDFGLADLTAAAMLAPLVGPANSPWSDARLPPVGLAQRQALRETLAGRWVLGLYARHR
jgi:glutathione S-transferase